MILKSYIYFQPFNRLTVLPDGTLRIMDVQKSNAGLYTCEAKNKHATDTVSYFLRVLGNLL